MYSVLAKSKLQKNSKVEKAALCVYWFDFHFSSFSGVGVAFPLDTLP